MRPRKAACCVAARMPSAEPDTSNTTSAPSPAVASAIVAGDVVCRGVEGGEPELLGEPASCRVRLDHEHLGAAGTRHERDEQPDRSAADDDCRLPVGHLAATHVVAGHRERLGERAEAQVDSRRQRVKRECRHRPRRLQRAGCVDAEKLQTTADVAEPAIGGRLTARVERPHHHSVADGEALHLRAERGNGSRHLVPDHLRRMNSPVHRTVCDVQVGAAQPAIGHIQPDISRTRLLLDAIADGEHALAFVVDRAHRTRTVRADRPSVDIVRSYDNS